MKKIIFSVFFVFISIQVSAGELIRVSASPQYHDPEIIPENIKSECTGLGNTFSSYTKQSLEKYGYTVELTDDISETSQGTNIRLTIVNAVSSGNAFMGHNKSVSMRADVIVDGKVVDTYKHTRNSRGGFGAGYKGSCAVLGRCAKALGKDVANWYKKKAKKQ
ncbi:hypothetical protein [Teredinibacter sp. KSP-S5-2]|uniref:hypothetical protein n=1 Tax=Teredinibacter sp. KSP-S5-2 TaxID=3034506 RepID=UPI00293468B6|nr:hypothetical protein [Teredinibacter sp. KSP-S5-2]WNO08912.1 hypothetical protein P5V12_18355 [Teredinibacter sp. KSP-S5-2]